MTDDVILAEAIRWRLRLRDESPQEWEAFVDWLERDPRHSTAYDSAAFAEDDADAAFAAAPLRIAANDDAAVTAAPSFRRRWLGVGALAAAFVGGVVALPSLMPGMSAVAVVTAPGERRVVDLGANRIEMNGGTRLILHKGDERFAALESGEAHFTIQHDPRQPFELQVGDDRIRDVGTAFDVVNDASGLRVAVSKGAVVFNPSAEAVQLAAGQALRRAAGQQQAEVQTIEPTDVGGWRAGRLSYRDAPLADVGQDVGRALGVTVTFDPSVAARPFTGVIHIDRDGPAMLRRLGLLLGLDVHGDADRWTLSPHRRAAR